MSGQKFYICKHCGNIIAMVKSVGVPIMCCGEKMQEIEPNTVDAAAEKHIPVVNICDNVVTVSVGSIEHPMTEEHLITWVSIETNEGNQRKELSEGKAPKAKFVLNEGEQLKAVYAYCNLHGLWKKEF